VSPHVYFIPGFPNIEIVVGNRATLVVDTGMGSENGAIVLRETQKLAKNPILYLTTTHFHPEHSAGEMAFPPNTVLARPAVQQQELEQRGPEFIQMFSSRNAKYKQLLAGVKQRKPDLVFDHDITLDLGGITAWLFTLGPAHTKGDEFVWVPEEGVLISGDIVQNKLVPNMPNADASPRNWNAMLDTLEALKPRFVLPDHGERGDGSLIPQQRAFMLTVEKRALELRSQGKSADDAAKLIADECKTKFPDWTNLGPIPNFVRRVYEE
jgi:glyoxylase-like metal-dependent hydrolase (beta-lactamase superfamily II)